MVIEMLRTVNVGESLRWIFIDLREISSKLFPSELCVHIHTQSPP